MTKIQNKKTLRKEFQTHLQMLESGSLKNSLDFWRLFEISITTPPTELINEQDRGINKLVICYQIALEFISISNQFIKNDVFWLAQFSKAAKPFNEALNKLKDGWNRGDLMDEIGNDDVLFISQTLEAYEHFQKEEVKPTCEHLSAGFDYICVNCLETVKAE